jgi:sulfide:quinone oxidoreductase
MAGITNAFNLAHAGVYKELQSIPPGGQWRESIHDFYTFDGALALRDKLRTFTGGRVVVHVVEMPIKCPVAPLEFAFLADAYFRGRGMRDRVELVYVTPLPGAFTKPIASARLGGMLEERKIALEPDFVVERIDADRKTLVSYDEREVPFDLLVTVPLNMGADYVARSGLGDELNYVPVDKHTFLSKAHDNVFAIGDATNLPISKSGSTAHFEAPVVASRIASLVKGTAPKANYGGRVMCFLETGGGKGTALRFDYEHPPVPPRPNRFWHLAKWMFNRLYWETVPQGRIPERAM